MTPQLVLVPFPWAYSTKLTLLLRRLDHTNELWRAVQLQLASTLARQALGSGDDEQQRGTRLTEINRLFENYSDSDFGRKLYLIQNSIFGVDIQTVACQIAKLRFFISLAIEQKVNQQPRDNYGIRPLPNLETRFVAADTLINLHHPGQQTLRSSQVDKLKQQIQVNRERHFHATTRQLKRQCIRADQRLRKALAKELERDGWGTPGCHQNCRMGPLRPKLQCPLV